MSRCFPYPPPGYEPRLRSEHKDLLKKERREGKKHREKNGTRRGERKEKDRGKGDRKGKDRDHKKLKREKRRERRKNKDRDKDNKTSEQETQKTDGFNNRREHKSVKYIKGSDQLVAFPGRGGHPNNKVNSTSELLPPSSKGFGAMASKKRESSLSRMMKQPGQTAQNYHGMVQKNGSIAYTNKKETDASVGYKTRVKNGKTLQVGSGEKQSNRRHSSKLKHMERSFQVNEQNKERNELDEQKFTCDNIKKRKELGANSLLENGARTTKLPRMSPTNNSVNGKALPNSEGSLLYSSMEIVGANTQEVEPQDGYSNGITDSCYLEQHKVSVSLSVYDTNEDYPKPPHPDTKYLSQVQSIPQMEKISECIDQDWLFSEDRVEQKTSFEAAESHQVWSNAQLIDTADVVALPYVVPL